MFLTKKGSKTSRHCPFKYTKYTGNRVFKYFVLNVSVQFTVLGVNKNNEELRDRTTHTYSTVCQNPFELIRLSRVTVL